MMKHALLYIVLLLPIFGWAQQTLSVPKDAQIIVYSLPKTELVIEVLAERVTQEPGDFYQYSERFLATKEVITTAKTFYRFKNVFITQKTVADSARTYVLTPSKKSIASKITVNEKGILCGMNVPVSRDSVRIERKIIRKNPEPAKLLPLNEEYMLAGSVAKMAEGAAKQIYHIRENRIALLGGEVDEMPKDGDSFKYLLNEMDVQEKKLTDLFTGTTSIEPVEQKIVYMPNSAVIKDVAFRLSSLSGVVAKDDLSGSPYYISVEFKPVSYIPEEKEKKKKTEDLFSILPVTAKVTLDDGKTVLFEEEMIIPQLGILVPIPTTALDKESKVSVSPVTGRLLSVQ